MIEVRCPASGQVILVGDALAGQSVPCTHCGQTHPVPPAAPAQPAAASVKRTSNLGVCVFHPDVPAVGRCRRCRKALCDTCSFRAGMERYCSECATTPEEDSGMSSLVKAIVSIACAGGSFVSIGAMIVFADTSTKEAETMAGCILLISLALAIVGLVFGLTTRGRARGGTVVGLIGAIISGLALLTLVLLIIAGFLAGGG